MATIETPRGELYYETHGEGDPLLCVMGLSADHLAWALQVPAWSAERQVVVFDNRDAGQSFRADGPYEVTDMAADALALADGLGLETFDLLGMSLGGAIAQEIALAAPERVRTLTLVVTYAWGGNWGRELARLWGARSMETSDEDHLDWLMLQTLSQDFYENADGVAFLRQMMAANPHPQPRDAFVRQLEAGSRHDTRGRLDAIAAPTHVIGAEYDSLVPVWKSAELAELIPGATLTVVPRAPHGVNVERAEEFNRAVLEFIAAQAGAPAAG